MLKQYIYSPSEAGFTQWPDGTLRLEGIEVTTDPRQADVFVCPGNIRIFELRTGSGVLDIDKLNKLPYFSGNESRHVFFDVSDNFKKPINLPITFIRCDVRTWMLPHDPNTIQMAWPVEDWGYMELPEGGFKYDVGCHAWSSTTVRVEAAESCQAHTALKCDIAMYPDFSGYLWDRATQAWTAEGLRRRQEFARSMRESRVSLCGESIPGVLPYRFFEAMSASRVPLLIGSDYVLPFADEIPYSEFILSVPSNQARSAGTVIKRFVASHSDEQIVEMGRKARHWWVKMLNSADWPKMMAYAVEKRLAVHV